MEHFGADVMTNASNVMTVGCRVIKWTEIAQDWYEHDDSDNNCTRTSSKFDEKLPTV